MYRYAPGFISRLSISDIPLVGLIACRLECVFLDRLSIKNREYVANEIKKRQEEFLSKKIHSPVLIFPEGTTSSGAHMLKFRRGSFEGLHPLKPVLLENPFKHFSLSIGVVPFGYHGLMCFATLYHRLIVTEMPIIRPTNYMYENYSKVNPDITDKAEVYAEVVREIYCEAGNFKKSEKGFKHMLDYIGGILDKKFKNL